MEAGKLRHRVTLQRATDVTDTFGQPLPTWTTFAVVWAAVEPLTGREYLQAQQQQAETTTRIRIRERAGVSERMRVAWGSHVYDIDAVITDPTNAREMVLMCTEAV